MQKHEPCCPECAEKQRVLARTLSEEEARNVAGGVNCPPLPPPWPGYHYTNSRPCGDIAKDGY